MSNLEHLIRNNRFDRETTVSESRGRKSNSPLVPPRCLAMAQSRRRRRRSFTFQFRRDGENARTCVNAHMHETIESALRERRSDRAIAPSTVTRAYTFGARSSPSGPPALPPRSLPPRSHRYISRSRYGRIKPTLLHSIVDALRGSPSPPSVCPPHLL